MTVFNMFFLRSQTCAVPPSTKIPLPGKAFEQRSLFSSIGEALQA
jgi:hypothetical protein